MEFEELNILIGDGGQAVAAEESQASPTLLELEERLAWRIGGTPVGEDMLCGVLGDVVSVCIDWNTDWSADSFQTLEGCPRGVPVERFGVFVHEVASSALIILVQGTDLPVC